MIDCHAHLLPGMDDGPDIIDQTISALNQMVQGGIKTVFCTTHYMRGLYQFSHDDYMVKFKELESEIKHQKIPIDIIPGAEIHIAYGISEDIRAQKLTLGDSNYILIETDLNGFPPDIHKNIYDLLRKGYKPILAHAERYVSVIMKSHEAKEMINRSVYIQVNAGSILGGYGDKVKQTVWKLLNKGWVHFMGSDHHCKSDYNTFFKARDKITEHIDEQTASLLTVNYPNQVLKNEKVEYDYVFVHNVPKMKYHTRIFKSLGF